MQITVQTDFHKLAADLLAGRPGHAVSSPEGLLEIYRDLAGTDCDWRFAAAIRDYVLNESARKKHAVPGLRFLSLCGEQSNMLTLRKLMELDSAWALEHAEEIAVAYGTPVATQWFQNWLAPRLDEPGTVQLAASLKNAERKIAQAITQAKKQRHAAAMRAEPIDVQRIKLSHDMDFDRFAADALAGKITLSTYPGDVSPLEAVERFYAEIADTPYGTVLARGIAKCLQSGDGKIRELASAFFQAGDAKRNLAAKAIVLSQVGKNDDYEFHRALGAIVTPHDTELIAAMRQIALKPGSLGVIAGLAAVDPVWVKEHADEIIRLTPAGREPIAFQLSRHAK